MAFPSILVEQNGADRKTAITEKIYNANFMNGRLYGVPAAYYYGGTGGVIFREDLRAKYDAAMPTSEGGWPSLEPYLQAILDNDRSYAVGSAAISGGRPAGCRRSQATA